MKRTVLFSALLFLSSTTVTAAQVWVPMFTAAGATIGCQRALWASDVVFYNRNDFGSVVTLLDIGDGTLPPQVATTVLVPAHAARSIPGGWWPPQNPGESFGYHLWVLHLDVPDGVTVDASDEFVAENLCVAPSSFGPAMKVPLPVFSSLVPAGTPQLKLGTDIGTAIARQNVTIYNAGEQTATAHIELRQGCDNALVDERIVKVPARTMVQFGGFTTASPGCTATATSSSYRYTVITVDQPSISYVTTIATTPTTDVVPIVQIGVR